MVQNMKRFYEKKIWSGSYYVKHLSCKPYCKHLECKLFTNFLLLQIICWNSVIGEHDANGLLNFINLEANFIFKNILAYSWNSIPAQIVNSANQQYDSNCATPQPYKVVYYLLQSSKYTSRIFPFNGRLSGSNKMNHWVIIRLFNA